MQASGLPPTCKAPKAISPSCEGSVKSEVSTGRSASSNIRSPQRSGIHGKRYISRGRIAHELHMPKPAKAASHPRVKDGRRVYKTLDERPDPSNRHCARAKPKRKPAGKLGSHGRRLRISDSP